MALSYAVTALQTSGYNANTNILGFGGQFRIVHGTWDANGSTTGSIVTGLSLIHACGVSIDTKAKSAMVALNDDGTGTTLNGSIGITGVTNTITGQWWAIGSD
jgi:hypothetical protein